MSECFHRLRWICFCDDGVHRIHSVSSENVHSMIQNTLLFTLSLYLFLVKFHSKKFNFNSIYTGINKSYIANYVKSSCEIFIFVPRHMCVTSASASSFLIILYLRCSRYCLSCLCLSFISTAPGFAGKRAPRNDITTVFLLSVLFDIRYFLFPARAGSAATAAFHSGLPRQVPAAPKKYVTSGTPATPS